MSFIFLSSLAEVEHVIAGLKLGADDYLTKPVDLDLLLVVVDNALKRVKRILKQGNELQNSAA
jgi:DNA-binding response OmpR family regulator